jgi:hypothetical protein
MAIAMSVVGFHNGDIYNILDLIGLVAVFEEDDIGLDGSAIGSNTDIDFFIEDINWEGTTITWDERPKQVV